MVNKLCHLPVGNHFYDLSNIKIVKIDPNDVNEARKKHNGKKEEKHSKDDEDDDDEHMPLGYIYSNKSIEMKMGKQIKKMSQSIN